MDVLQVPIWIHILKYCFSSSAVQFPIWVFSTSPHSGKPLYSTVDIIKSMVRNSFLYLIST
jgi:hypothetical protein